MELYLYLRSVCTLINRSFNEEPYATLRFDMQRSRALNKTVLTK